jgi:hypothetical protein
VRGPEGRRGIRTMLQRVHIQILDNPIEGVMLDAEEFEEPIKNKLLADELRKEMNYSYPSVVAVEYIDLFLNDDLNFSEIRDLLSQGAINTPVILINGIPKIHGGIPSMIIKEEVEKLLSAGPLH